MAIIYGLIFGSAHPLGIDKFLHVAWQKDVISGEANFDIDRDDIRPGQLMFEFAESRSTKVAAFEVELEELLRNGSLKNESEVMRVCFEQGMKRQHAEPVLAKLKQERADPA